MTPKQGAGSNVLTRGTSTAGGVIGVLDIGTSKTVCLIVAAPASRGGLWRREGACVLGFGHRPSRGLKAGAVIDPDGAEQSLRAVVTLAERPAGLTIEDVLVGVTCGRLRSVTFEAETRIEGEVVDTADADRLLAAGRKYAQRDGRTLLHLNRIVYRLDGAIAGPDPFGMGGTMLAADLHAVTVEEAPLRSLLYVVERAGLSPAGLAAAPYASGLAATTPEERHLGATCIDMGAGTTTLSMFRDGQLISVATVAVGGQHLTFDIARTLAIQFVEAERIKTHHGSLERAASEDAEPVAYTPIGEQEQILLRATGADLHSIVAGRISDLLSQVAERIESTGVAELAAHRVVLTGGGSQLPGLAEFAEEALGRPVRVGRPKPLPGMPAHGCAPQFSTAAGLVQIALNPAAGVPMSGGRGTTEGAGYLKRVGQWLREGL
jgi:cell division protein FtsA